MTPTAAVGRAVRSSGRAAPLAHDVAPPSGSYRWVRVWGWPIRATHWVAVASILALVVTGFYIGAPYFVIHGPTSAHYFMATVRFVHFVAAWALVACGILRVYWLFAGNRFERWRALFPVGKPDWINMWKQVKFYLMIRPESAPHYLGHNPLQQLSYTALYGVAVLEIVTGFVLYGHYRPDGVWHVLAHGLAPTLGGLQIVRFIHHVLTWIFLIFIPIHVYLVLREDLLEHGGMMSSIISGSRFLRTDIEYVDQRE